MMRYLALGLFAASTGCSHLDDDVVCLAVDDGAACPSLAAADAQLGLYCATGGPPRRVVEITAFDHRDNTVSCVGGKGMCSSSELPLDLCCYEAKVELLDGTCGVVDARPRAWEERLAAK
jgi:hypothetical protein